MNVYLDYAATTPLSDSVFQAMLPLLKENFGNPDSLHSFGRNAALKVTAARDCVAQILGVSPSEVYFTSGGTESDNWAIRGLINEKKRGIALSNIEHQAALSAAQICQNEGREVVFIPANEQGIITAQAVERALTPQTGLVCVMAANNETGCIQPIEEISAVCKRQGILLFCDCVQGANVLNLKELIPFCDALSLSAHKIYGPKGSGLLYVKKGVKISPLIAGGEQERGLRGGTVNAAGIVGLSKALEEAQARREEFCRHTQALRDLFEKKILAELQNEVIIDGINRAPNVSHITFVRGGEALLSLLDLNGIACSGGAACSAHAALPSHVMLAMGKSAEEAKRGVRFSFGKDTTEEQALFAANAVISCYRSFEAL